MGWLSIGWGDTRPRRIGWYDLWQRVRGTPSLRRHVQARSSGPFQRFSSVCINMRRVRGQRGRCERSVQSVPVGFYGLAVVRPQHYVLRYMLYYYWCIAKTVKTATLSSLHHNLALTLRCSTTALYFALSPFLSIFPVAPLGSSSATMNKSSTFGTLNFANVLPAVAIMSEAVTPGLVTHTQAPTTSPSLSSGRAKTEHSRTAECSQIAASTSEQSCHQQAHTASVNEIVRIPPCQNKNRAPAYRIAG